MVFINKDYYLKVLKVFIQLVSVYRAVAMFIFILYYTIIPYLINAILLITAVLSDLLDGYLARKYNLTSVGGKLLDLFSDKYLNFISIIFLIIEGYPLCPLLMILTKEIFVLSFRSIEIDGEFIISTNRLIGGIMCSMLWSAVFLHLSKMLLLEVRGIVIILGILNFFYLIYKIVSNRTKLKKIFDQ